MKKRAVILIILLISIVALRFSPAGEIITFDNLKTNSEMLKENVDEHYFMYALIYVLTYIIVIGLSIPGALVLTVSSGFLFGAVLGTLLTNIGATIGATIIFLLARYFIGDWVQNKYAKRLEKINKDIEKNGRNYLITLRLIPLFPFFMINLAAAVSRVRLPTFVWTTSLGIVAGSFVYAFAGSQLGQLTDLKSVFSPGIVMAFVLLGLLSLTPVVYRKVTKNAV